MKNNDVKLLEEAYQTILEKSNTCKSAKDGCDCDNCKECKANQKKNVSSKSKQKRNNELPSFLKKNKEANAPASKKKNKLEIKEGVLFDEVCRLLNC